MGMHYNVTFHNAIIKPERFEAMLRNEATADMSQAELWEAALIHVNDCIDDWDTADQNPDTGEITLDGIGFHDGASYGFGERLTALLSFCEPGAFIHEIDDEESTGEQWRHVKMPDGTVRTFAPTITWPAEAGGETNA